MTGESSSPVHGHTALPVHERIAKVDYTMLGYEDHGILTAYVGLDFGGLHQGAGGYSFDEWDAALNRRVVRSGFGLAFVAAVINAAGVTKWEDVKGRTLFALTEGEGFGQKIVGLAPLPTEMGERFLFAHLVDEFHLEAEAHS